MRKKTLFLVAVVLFVFAANAYPDTFIVHVSSFKIKNYAALEVKRLEKLGYTTLIKIVELEKNGVLRRVYLGPYKNYAQAEAITQSAFEKKHISYKSIIKENPQLKPADSVTKVPREIKQPKNYSKLKDKPVEQKERPKCIVHMSELKGLYEGGCEKGIANGYGKALGLWSYVGFFKNGQPSGKGVLINSGGDRYEGFFNDAVFFGNGTLEKSDGSKYVGKFNNGEYNGPGVLELADGTIIKGNFLDGAIFGKGILKKLNGELYDGQFINGKMDGAGVYIWPLGERYKGEFKNGKMHGDGTLSKVDGGVYAGEFKNSKMHGMGQYTNADGTWYKGEWKDNQMHGKGKERIKTASQRFKIRKGIWERGKFIASDKNRFIF